MLPRPAHVRGKGASLASLSRDETSAHRMVVSHAAQILKAELWQKGSKTNGAVGPHYFVHYKGWKQTCVPVALLLLGDSHKATS